VLSEYLQHIRQQGDARTEEDEPDNIERRRLLTSEIKELACYRHIEDQLRPWPPHFQSLASACSNTMETDYLSRLSPIA